MNSKHSQPVPRVFISSTAEDLRAYREAAKEAAIGVEMLPKMMEYFVASGDNPPLEKCLAEVSGPMSWSSLSASAMVGFRPISPDPF